MKEMTHHLLSVDSFVFCAERIIMLTSLRGLPLLIIIGNQNYCLINFIGSSPVINFYSQIQRQAVVILTNYDLELFYVNTLVQLHIVSAWIIYNHDRDQFCIYCYLVTLFEIEQEVTNII